MLALVTASVCSTSLTRRDGDCGQLAGPRRCLQVCLEQCMVWTGSVERVWISRSQQTLTRLRSQGDLVAALRATGPLSVSTHLPVFFSSDNPLDCGGLSKLVMALILREHHRLAKHRTFNPISLKSIKYYMIV